MRLWSFKTFCLEHEKGGFSSSVVLYLPVISAKSKFVGMTFEVFARDMVEASGACRAFVGRERSAYGHGRGLSCVGSEYGGPAAKYHRNVARMSVRPGRGTGLHIRRIVVAFDTPGGAGMLVALCLPL